MTSPVENNEEFQKILQENENLKEKLAKIAVF
jgi:hypothetical protein